VHTGLHAIRTVVMIHATLVNTQTHTLLFTGYTIISASRAKKTSSRWSVLLSWLAFFPEKFGWKIRARSQF